MPDAAPDTRSAAHVDRTHAAVGCLLGAAVRDALGLAVEGLSARRQARMYPQLDNYHFLFGHGCISDDTEHTCMLAQALIVSLDEDTERFVRKFGSSLGWRLRFRFLGLPAGMGLATGRAIIKLWLGFPARLSGVRSAGNGPAMRAALLGVCFDDRDQLHAAVRAATQVTHRHPDAFDGALLVALAAQVSASHENIKPARFLGMARAHLPAQSALIVDLIHVVNSIGVGEQTAEFITGLGCKKGGRATFAIPCRPRCMCGSPTRTTTNKPCCAPSTSAAIPTPVRQLSAQLWAPGSGRRAFQLNGWTDFASGLAASRGCDG